MASASVAPPSAFRNTDTDASSGALDTLPDEMNEMKLRDDKVCTSPHLILPTIHIPDFRQLVMTIHVIILLDLVGAATICFCFHPLPGHMLH